MGLVKLTITISFWIFIVNGSCPFEYYQCSEFLDWCCPDDYKCTGNNSCDNNSIYPTSSSGGAIVGGILGGIVLIAVVCGCISAAVKSNHGTFRSVVVPRRNLVDGKTITKEHLPS